MSDFFLPTLVAALAAIGDNLECNDTPAQARLSTRLIDLLLSVRELAALDENGDFRRLVLLTAPEFVRQFELVMLRPLFDGFAWRDYELPTFQVVPVALPK